MGIGDDDALPAFHDADTCDHAGAGRLPVVLVVGDQQADLEPRGTGIKQALHPLAGRKLAFLAHPGGALGAPAFA